MVWCLHLMGRAHREKVTGLTWGDWVEQLHSGRDLYNNPEQCHSLGRACYFFSFQENRSTETERKFLEICIAVEAALHPRT